MTRVDMGVGAALTAVAVVLGMDRGDTFEIPATTLVWFTLLVSGPLIAVRFHRDLRF